MISRIKGLFRIVMILNVIIIEKFECPFPIIAIILCRSLVKRLCMMQLKTKVGGHSGGQSLRF